MYTIGEFRSSVKHILDSLRGVAPYLSGLSDFKFALLVYFIACTAICIICYALKSTQPSYSLDSRRLFDSGTKLMEQKLEIEQLRKAVSEQDQLQRDYQGIQEKLCEERLLTTSLRAKMIDPKVIDEKDQVIATLEHQLQNELAQIKKDLDSEFSKLSELRTEVKELGAEVHTKQQTIEKLTSKIGELKSTLQQSNENAAFLQKKYDGVLVMLGENKAYHVEEMESDDAEVEFGKKNEVKAKMRKLSQPKAEAWTADELKELIKAKVELRKLEAERDQLNLKLQAGQSEKGVCEERISHLNKEVEALRTELKEKKTLADKREDEASSQREQLNKLLEMINEKDQKIGRAEAEHGTLKDTIRHLEAEVHKFEIVKQQNDQKIKELEDRIDKADEQKSKLQNRWFHDERNYSTKIRTLEETIAKLQTSLSTFNASFDAPNAASPMSERDYPGGNDDVPDLWSPFNANSSVRRERHLAPGSTTGSNNASFQLDTSDEASQQIRLHRPLVHRESQEKRRRSRSTGRVDQYANYSSGRRSAHQSGHVSPATSLLLNQPTSLASPFYERRESSGINRPPSTGTSRLPKSASNASNMLYYSSDGSNRSPPTEFVQKSGVPPANPAALIRKPKNVVRSTGPLNLVSAMPKKSR